MKTIRAVLKYLHSPDTDDLEAFAPADPQWGLLVQAAFGPEGSDGEETFDVFVCSVDWMAREVERDRIVHCRHRLVVKEFDYQELLKFFNAYAESCTGNTWHTVADKLSRLGRWEFEDYESDGA